MRSLIVFAAIVGVALAQYEAGHVKILQDKRYQEGAAFGNYRDQEDGIKYQEETDLNGIRRGFWEYPDENGKILRVEFEAGAGIGFRITNSNYLASSIADNSIPAPRQPVAPVQPRHQAPVEPRHQAPVQPRHQAPVQPRHQAPVQPRPQAPVQPRHQAPVQPRHQAPVQQRVAPVQHIPQAPLPVFRPHHVPTTTPHGPINLFDYPANLDFQRHAHGHSFSFSAV